MVLHIYSVGKLSFYGAHMTLRSEIGEQRFHEKGKDTQFLRKPFGENQKDNSEIPYTEFRERSKTIK